MSIYVIIYAESSDFAITSTGVSHATRLTALNSAKNGTFTKTLQADTDVTHDLKKEAISAVSPFQYELSQYFASFDLTTVSTPGEAQFRLTFSSTYGASSTVISIRPYAWSSASTAEWRTINQLSALSLISNQVVNSAGLTSFPVSGTLTGSAVNKIVVHHSDNASSADSPISTRGFILHSADAAGTTDDPYLIVVSGSSWELVGISSVTEVTTTTHTLTEPAGAQEGDLLIACFSIRKNNTTATSLPADWNIVGEQYNSNTATNNSATPSGLMAYIIRGSSAPSYTFTHSGTISVAQGVVLCYRNADPTATLDHSNSITSGTAVTAINVAAGVTTTQDDDLLVCLRAGGQESTMTGWAAATDPTSASGATNTSSNPAPNAWLERVDTVTTTGNDTAVSVFDAVKTAAGATGNMMGTASISSAHVIVTGAFKIVPGTPPPAVERRQAPVVRLTAVHRASFH